MSSKDADTRIEKKTTTRKKTAGRKRKKRDSIIMVSLILFVLLVVFGVYSLQNRNNGPEPTGPVPLEEDDSMKVEFNLTAGGKHTVSISPGESFTVTYRIYRIDKDSDFIIHSVQDEIEFNTDVFELIQDSISCGYTVSIHDYDGARCRVFMNTYAITPEGFEYKQGAEFGSFTLKVKDNAPFGSYEITNNSCEMAAPGGFSTYAYTVRDLTVNIAAE